MKRVLIAFAILALSGGAFAQTPGTSLLIGSGHDMTAQTGDTANQICVYCHTPHYRQATLQYPLWNHTLSSTASYTMYTSTTMNATAAALSGGTIGTANTTQMCLSCHDGTVTLGNLYNGPNGGVGSTASVTGNALFGTDLSNDHPINIDYDTALSTADGELYDPAAQAATLALLDNGQVQCASCHDPHNVTAGEQPFLVMSNTNSALCATCHIK